MNIVEEAYRFARKAHKEQVYNNKPYINHLAEVASIIKKVRPLDYELQSAAYLHDILEDTNITPAQLTEAFGANITALVYEVTQDEHRNFPNLKTIRGLILKSADQLMNVNHLEEIFDKERQEKLFRKYSYGFIHRGDILKGDGIYDRN